MMKINKNLCDLFFSGASKTYFSVTQQSLAFDGQVSKFTEYRFTVKIMDELEKWNAENGYQYLIEAEKSTFELFSGCFPISVKEDENCIFSKDHFCSTNPEYEANLGKIRKGKVDIALSTEGGTWNNESKFIIEVKPINPTITKLKEDFVRIENFLTSTVPRFPNLLEGGYLVFIKHINNPKRVQSREDLAMRKKEYLKQLEVKLKDISKNNISFTIQTKEIDMVSSENLHFEDRDDFHEHAYNTFMVFCVVVEITRKGA